MSESLPSNPLVRRHTVLLILALVGCSRQQSEFPPTDRATVTLGASDILSQGFGVAPKEQTVYVERSDGGPLEGATVVVVPPGKCRMFVPDGKDWHVAACPPAAPAAPVQSATPAPPHFYDDLREESRGG